ncbi:hypothetical protein ACT17_30285 [Mycolicibacterium conceptionense]|uniref:Uncharacterized protein n=2 Tax=Mycolicibacterium TaxID=1866885 RepID=A0ABR5FUN6_9MYCO|nr:MULTISPECIES: hypothetical protein [Mycolicibacterium]KLI09692.1 hypothetical protein AA982_03220 [Mycolicibacterium senegalense]KLO51670.1 hypothetical protein ABW05_09170 [Mycolicibacterium senegalense]KMV14439.1 hypothetical protein ACT17_30285 [Mycolicibacterium conceptionense]OBJ96740.1 hypothetical protein A5639_03045 [Mycolicibacterium conceptionense]OMB69650.1 hypothetical protein A5741_08820 [Mycolicibacterium conceptionense]
MTVVAERELHLLTRSEQVEHLRRKIASVSGKVGPAHRGAPRSTAVISPPESLLSPSETLVDALPEGLPTMLPRGSVAVAVGARSLSLGMVAAVTAGGGHAVIIGQPDVGLLAAVEMGADLSRLAVIPDPGADPVEVASVLMDGMDLVVLGLGGRSVPPSRARVMVARARQKGCTLLVTDGDWQGASARLEARVSGYEVVGAGQDIPMPGRGRISRVRLAMRARGRGVGSGRAAGG